MTDNMFEHIESPLAYLKEVFFDNLIVQLQNDQARWGDAWADYPREGQEERIFNRIKDYFEQWFHTDEPMPWLKVAGYCVIAMLREEISEMVEDL